MKLNLKKNKDFSVQDFMNEVETDFIYSVDENGNYLLLNESMYGIVERKDIDNQVNSGLRVVVIDNKDMSLRSYNIDEISVVDAVNTNYSDN